MPFTHCFGHMWLYDAGVVLQVTLIFNVTQLEDGGLAFALSRSFVHSLAQQHAKDMYALCNRARREQQPQCSAEAVVLGACMCVHQAWQSWSSPSLAEPSLLGKPWPCSAQQDSSQQGQSSSVAGARVSLWAPRPTCDEGSLGAHGSPEWRLSQDWRLSEGATQCVAQTAHDATESGKNAFRRSAARAEACENVSHNVQPKGHAR